MSKVMICYVLFKISFFFFSFLSLKFIKKLRRNTFVVDSVVFVCDIGV